MKSDSRDPSNYSGELMLPALAIAIVGMIVDQVIIAGAPPWATAREVRYIDCDLRVVEMWSAIWVGGSRGSFV
jgi:hypothetical protein